ncbi:ATP-binding protein [Silvibacterium dinghuense]|uniref:histidine kinase n=1 Tax=Silvibacterium dinghuense TaxID=1560006 RepID=A0A4Q1SDL3_9BACT|nr:ATP-binding protein [Silvibacterium dinghuense]RXS95193.1 HAMP domain-containing protein [Silvibacterium dinghuense]GGH11428.1 two-component sensor histidine kinase [Silvibacterium dinghuense]
MPHLPLSLRSRLTLWYVAVLAVLLLVYASLVFAFQYAVLSRQIFHDEVQDVVTAEGLLYFDQSGSLHMQDNYYSRPQSHLLVDRLMEVRDLSGLVLYRSPALHGMPLGGPLRRDEGDRSFNERAVRLEDGTYAVIISHIHTLNGVTMVIRLGYSLAPLRERMTQFLVLLLIAVPLALLVAGAAGQIIAARALRPLKEMTERAQGITANNLHDRLEIANPGDELGQLAKVFNHLLGRLDEAFQQLKRFTADAAHELRTPLASIRTMSEVTLEQHAGLDTYQETLESVLEETARLNETINGLLLLARAESSQPGEAQSAFVVRDLVDEVLGVLEVLIEEKQLTVRQDGDAMRNITVLADRSLLRIAFMNVLHNAVKYSPRGSFLDIHWRLESDRLGIDFQDEGPGIPRDEQQKVFERFYTSRALANASGSGAGLGLSIAKLIVDRIGGKMTFEEVEHGARCVIEVPLSAGSDGYRSFEKV